jgi:hypothetical protein
MRNFILSVAITIVSLLPASAAPSNPGGYYVEFRVAQIGPYGHSYVAYGRLGSNGKPKDVQYADLHPVGNYALMALGHVVPVPATAIWDPEVERLPIADNYQRRLSAAQYARLVEAIRRARTDKLPYWNAATNNCNHFVAELARAVGLRAPSVYQVSYAFISALRELNSGEKQKVGLIGQ